MIIRELFVLLGAKTDSREFQEAERRIAGVKRLLTAASVAAAGLGAALAASTRAFTREAQVIDEWSARIGAGPEQLSALKGALEGVGIEGVDGFEAITDAAERAGDVLLNVGKLTGDAGESFKALGFRSVAELRGADGRLRNSFELFQDLVQRLKNVENQGERTGIAMRLFGDDVGRRIVPFIERYGDQLDRVVSGQLAFGAVITRADIERVRQYNLALNGVRLFFSSLAFTAGRSLLPSLTKVLDRVNAWISLNRQLVRQRIERVVEVIARAVEFAFVKTEAYARMIDSVVDKMGGWRRIMLVLGAVLSFFALQSVGRLALALGSLANVLVGRLLPALFTLNLRMLVASAGPALLGAAFVAFALILDDVFTTIQGGDSIISRFVKRFDPADTRPDEWWVITALRTAVGLVQDLGRGLGALYTVFTESGSIADEALAGLSRGVNRNPLLRAAADLGDALVSRPIGGVAPGASVPVPAAVPANAFVGPRLTGPQRARIQQQNTINVDARGAVPGVAAEVEQAVKDGMTAAAREFQRAVR